VLPPAEKDLIVTFLASAISPNETPWGPLRRDRSEGGQTVRRPLAPAAAIHRERHWRDRLREERPADSLVLGRWTHDSEGGQDWLAPADPTHFVIEIALRGAQAEIFTGASPLRPGRLSAGQVHIVAAGQEGRGLFRGPCDLLHLFVPTSLAGALCDGVDGRDALNRLAGGPPWTDPEVERLALALVRPVPAGNSIAGLYCEGLGSAILARVFARAVQGPGSGPAGAGGLVRWRLKRVADYVDSNFAEPLRLADLARCAGLSRMHFAAQFRAATGLRPHEYVLRHRIERARELLRDPSVPLVEVALSVGFQTQAHFSTVFRQLVGETPGRWRQSQCQDRGASPCRS
jgi:AraC-like DNA-binding protein